MEKPLDVRPKCIRCKERWIPPEGVDAQIHPCPECKSPYRLVVLESPFKGKSKDEKERKRETERNIAYARAALRDSALRGEAALASHLLYTQPGVLDDQNHGERRIGIEAGLAWVDKAEATVVYTDLGISKGMQEGIDRAKKAGRPVLYRLLGDPWSTIDIDT